MSVSRFDHRAVRCPFGHLLWPGMAQVGWKTCSCTAAREADETGRGMGTSGCHVTPVTTNSGRRRSTSRLTTSIITNPLPDKQARPPDMPLLTPKRQAGEQLLRA